MTVIETNGVWFDLKEFTDNCFNALRAQDRESAYQALDRLGQVFEKHKVASDFAKASNNERLVNALNSRTRQILLFMLELIVAAAGSEGARFVKEDIPWIVACHEAREWNNPQRFIDLLALLVPAEPMKHIEDLLNFKFCKHKKGHHSRPLYYSHPTEVAANMVHSMVQEGVKVSVAIDLFSLEVGRLPRHLGVV